MADVKVTSVITLVAVILQQERSYDGSGGNLVTTPFSVLCRAIS